VMDRLSPPAPRFALVGAGRVVAAAVGPLGFESSRLSLHSGIVTKAPTSTLCVHALNHTHGRIDCSLRGVIDAIHGCCHIPEPPNWAQTRVHSR